MKRYIVIGDIHGCYEELQSLLDIVSPTANDEIVAVGDIVDRGPWTEKVLEFFRDTPNARSILGNHERKHLRAAQGLTWLATAQKIVKQQLGDRYDNWLAYMATFARFEELPGALIVHGMFEPGVTLDEQRENVLVGVMSGTRYLKNTYTKPWYDLYTGPTPIVVGHHNYLGSVEPLIREGLVYAIDTGVVHGGRLTALVLPEFRIVSVRSRGDHWAEQQRQYAVCGK